ncbi:MAG: S8 family serine peptidase [Candidatus Brocadiae bacterium]|nr:S8 family serine peptidase [Candidatus Brocadiia bacterium]
MSPWFVVFVAPTGVALLSTLLPAEDPFPGRDPGVMRAEQLIIAVLDTGVDATHKDLADAVLPGWNVLDGSDDTKDRIGHGTAVAGLIAAHGDGRGAMKGIAPGVRILPVKVVSDSSGDTFAPMLSIGIEYALKQGARIICIPLGAPRGSASLKEALDRCQEQGVLVVAAAGIASGTQDYWPAAHPWAVSCTASSGTVLSDRDGMPSHSVTAVSTRANLTPKTELAGDPSSQSTRPGDSYGPLEGTSAVAARAAGVAARIWLADPKLTAGEVRRILVDSGPRIGTPNFQNVYRTTVLDLEAALACADAGKPDLGVRSAILRPYPWHPGEKRLAEAVVTNCGRRKAGGKLAVDIDRKYTFDIPELEPGATQRIEFEIPAEATLDGGRARVSVENVPGEGNASNNVLHISVAERPRDGVAVMVQSAGVESMGVEPGKAKVWAVIRNLETSEELPADVSLKTSNGRWSRPVRIAAGGETRVEADWDLPEGSSDILEVTVEVKGKQTDATRTGVLLEDGPVTLQYADVWDRDEIIFDMPWAVIEGRTEIPLLVFVPETKNVGMAIDGVWLKDIKVWRSGSATIHGFTPTRFYWGQGETPIYGASADILSGRDTSAADGAGGAWEKFSSVPVESETGEHLSQVEVRRVKPAGIVGFINYPSWHRIIRVPMADPATNMYFTARAVASYFRFRPPSESAGFPSIDQDDITIKVMRVQTVKPMPMLSKDGKYWDTHVHTAAEYSTQIADPRLAWGGPPRMLAWTAYSLGMIDSPDAAALRDKVITTDHNCFFSDQDVPQFPPFRSAPPDMEYRRLRELMGLRTGAQEVSMYRAGALGPGPHALVYEHHSHFPGPWFGDRSQLDFLKSSMPYLDDALHLIAKGIIGRIQESRAVKLGLDLARRIWAGGGDEEEWTSLEQEIRDESTQGELSAGFKVKAATRLALCLSHPDRVKQIRRELDLCLKNAQVSQVPNVNSQEHVLEQMKGSRAHAYAAHPTNGMFAWTPLEIEQWLNAHPSTRKLSATRDGQFMTSGLQIWNDPKKKCAHLRHSEDLFFINPWSAMHDRYDWHAELSTGFMLHTRMARAGMQYAFDDDPDRGTFIRKVYFSAGSDAHGDFNFSTGVTASIMSHHGIEPFMMLFGSGSGAEAYDGAYAKCRTYALGGTIDDLYHGRTAVTDGPLLDVRIDSDLRFEIGPATPGSTERVWLWHDKWDAAEKGRDDDGLVGGDGAFDGLRTAAVRRGCGHVVANLRAATAETWGGRLTQVDAYWWDRETPARFRTPRDVFEYMEWAAAEGKRKRVEVNELVPSQEIDAFDREKAVRLNLQPTCTGAVMLGGFSTPFERYHPDSNQCFTNPVWFTTVDIKPQIQQVRKEGGKAVIPAKKLNVRFRTDISMQRGLTSRVFIQQLDSNGDSCGPRIPLAPAGPWRDLTDPKDPAKVLMKSCLMDAFNDAPVPIVEPWYPRDGVTTWVVVLADVVDANGNRLNEVADTFAASVPVDTGNPGDPGGSGDGGGAPKDPMDENSGQGGGGTTPTEMARVQVNPGETIDLPRGGMIDGRKIPPGPFAVPDPLPDGGLLVAVACSTQETVLVLLTASMERPTPDLRRQGGTWVAEAPKQPGTVESVSFKNHDDRSITVGEPLVCSASGTAFAAPRAGAGRGDLRVTQGGKTVSYPVEAVAPTIEWDRVDAAVGDVRVLSLRLAGASNPGDWTVSGDIQVQNGRLVARARGVTGQGAALVLTRVPGTLSEIARFEALSEGQMTALATLRAVRK